MIRLEGPGDERREAARLVLELTHPVEMLHAFLDRLDVAEHHRGRGSASRFVPDPMDIQPVFRHDLAAGDRIANAIDEDLGPAARQTAETRRLESLKDGP